MLLVGLAIAVDLVPKRMQNHFQLPSKLHKMGKFVLEQISEDQNDYKLFGFDTREDYEKEIEKLVQSSDGARRTHRKNRVLPEKFFIVGHSLSRGYETVENTDGKVLERKLTTVTRHFNIALTAKGDVFTELYLSTCVTPQVDEISGSFALVGADGSFNTICIEVDNLPLTDAEKYEKIFQKAKGKEIHCKSIPYGKTTWGNTRFTYTLDIEK